MFYVVLEKRIQRSCEIGSLSRNTGCVKSTFIELDFISFIIVSKPITIPIIGAKRPTTIATPLNSLITSGIPRTVKVYSTSIPFTYDHARITSVNVTAKDRNTGLLNKAHK